MIPVTNLADIIALGGFNPNKYMLPAHYTAIGRTDGDVVAGSAHR